LGIGTVIDKDILTLTWNSAFEGQEKWIFDEEIIKISCPAHIPN